MKHALYDVLRMKGMNRHGKPLDDKGEVQEKLDSPIKGSLEITLKKHAATSTDIELRQDLQKIVEKILLQLGGSRNP